MGRIEIQWTDTDPETGQRRYLRAERFAKVWQFQCKLKRRGEWTALPDISPALVDAVIASEDHRFRSHAGVDWAGMLGAARPNWN